MDAEGRGADDYATTTLIVASELRFAFNNLASIVRNLHGSNRESLMSALGQKRTLQRFLVMSALPPKADIGTQPRNVRFVPQADILHRVYGRDPRAKSV